MLSNEFIISEIDVGAPDGDGVNQLVTRSTRHSQILVTTDELTVWRVDRCDNELNVRN